MRAAGTLTAMGVLVLTGCGQHEARSAPDEPRSLAEPRMLSVHRGLSSGLRPAGPSTRPVAAILGPGRLALATWGSSSCPWTPVRFEVRGPETVTVVLDLPGSGRRICTADLGPSTVRLQVDPVMTRDGAVDLALDFPRNRNDTRVVARPLRDERD